MHLGPAAEGLKLLNVLKDNDNWACISKCYSTQRCGGLSVVFVGNGFEGTYSLKGFEATHEKRKPHQLPVYCNNQNAIYDKAEL